MSEASQKVMFAILVCGFLVSGVKCMADKGGQCDWPNGRCYNEEKLR